MESQGTGSLPSQSLDPPAPATPAPAQAQAHKPYLHRFKGGGTSPDRHPIFHIAASWVGGFLGIFTVTIPASYLHLTQATLVGLIGSFGASAVLIYGLPRADLAQPRNFVGGHVVSAIMGVTSYMLLGSHLPVAAGVAVASAIAGMHLTKTLHPPGGATALIAVVGGPGVTTLGYRYVITPVLVGALMMLVVALVMNNLHIDDRRHYPKYWW